MRQSIIKLGENKGTPRVYLQGKWLLAAGFNPGATYAVEYGHGTVQITVQPLGGRRISAKAGNVPVIDVQNEQLAAALQHAEQLQITAGGETITITPAHTARLQAGRQLLPTEASLFTGGGLLSHAATLAGFRPIMGVERDERFADVYAANNPGADVYACSVEQVSLQQLLAYRGKVGVLTMGVPCEPFSTSRRNNPGCTLPPEAHDLGDMTFWALRAVEAINPHTVVIEQAPAYLTSAAGFILQHALRRLGYTVDGRVIDPLQYGQLTGRKRTVIVATAAPAVIWPEPSDAARKLGEILLAADDSRCEWFTEADKPWLFTHWRQQAERGNGFGVSRVFDANSRHFPTIKKRYFNGQGDGAVIAHPTRPGTYRWLTLDEAKALHACEGLQLPAAKTLAGNIIGQGVLVDLFRQIIQAAAVAA